MAAAAGGTSAASAVPPVVAAAEQSARDLIQARSTLYGARQDALNALIDASNVWVPMQIPSGETLDTLRDRYTELLATIKPSYSTVVSGTQHVEEEARAREALDVAVAVAQCLHDSDANATEIIKWLDIAVAGNVRRAIHNRAFMMEHDPSTHLDVLIGMYGRAGMACSIFRAGVISLKMSKTVEQRTMSLQLVKVAADSDHPEANFILGEEYGRGMAALDGSCDPSNGIVYLEKARDHGVVLAYQELAQVHTRIAESILHEEIDMTEEGGAKKVAQREQRARAHLREANKAMKQGTSKGDVACMEMYGRSLVRGFGAKRDLKKGYLQLKRAGECGSIPAMHDAATMLRRGEGVKLDSNEALRILKFLADKKNYTPAMSDLAMALQETDPTESMRYLNAAIADRYVPAIAYALMEGLEVEKSARYNELLVNLTGVALPGSKHPHAELARRALVHLGKLNMCSKCNNFGLSMKKCGRCEGAHYCSAECQSTHWPLHKKTCMKTGDSTPP